MRRLLALPLVLALVAAGCGDDDAEGGGGGGDGGGTLTVYSGRSEELVGPLLEQFSEDTGIEVEVRYGNTAEMAGTILEEGENSPADVFYAQDAGALGALSSEGLLEPLDEDLVAAVAEEFRSADGEWVGTSGRARVVAYNTTAVSEDELPSSILGFTDPAWRGRLGWAPTNGSFQAFVTALRVLEGEGAARAWLEGVQANDPVVFDGNIPIVEAVAAGEIDAGFVNHYYLFQLRSEGADVGDVANYYYTNGDPGALVNVAGVAILRTSDDQEAARRFVEYMLEASAQEYFATETYELPLVEGVEADPALPDLEALSQPDIDLDDLEDLEGTVALLTELGIL